MIKIKKYGAIDIGSNAIRLLISNVIIIKSNIMLLKYPFWISLLSEYIQDLHMDFCWLLVQRHANRVVKLHGQARLVILESLRVESDQMLRPIIDNRDFLSFGLVSQPFDISSGPFEIVSVIVITGWKFLRWLLLAYGLKWHVVALFIKILSILYL